MQDDWLLGTLRDIGVYAAMNNLHSLVPLMEQAYQAARQEIRPASPIPMSWPIATRSANDPSPPSASRVHVELARVVVLPSKSISCDYSSSRDIAVI